MNYLNPRFSAFFSLTVICCFSVAVLLPSIASAQGVSVTTNGPVLSGFGEVDLDKTVEHWEEREAETIERTMDLQVDQIISVLELDEDESRRIRVAVKGIAAERIEAGALQIREFAYQSRLVEAPEEGRDDTPDEEVDSHNYLLIYGASAIGNQTVDLRTTFETPLTEHPLWIRTLKNTLSEEKFGRYREYRLQRHQSHLDAAIQSWVSNLDAELFLSEEQSSRLSELMKQRLSDQVTIEGPNSVVAASLLATEAFDNDPLDSILTEPQMEHRRAIEQSNQMRSGVFWEARGRR